MDTCTCKKSMGHYQPCCDLKEAQFSSLNSFYMEILNRVELYVCNLLEKLDMMVGEEPHKKQYKNLRIKVRRISNKSMVMTQEFPATLDRIRGSQATSMQTTRHTYSKAKMLEDLLPNNGHWHIMKQSIFHKTICFVKLLIWQLDGFMHSIISINQVFQIVTTPPCYKCTQTIITAHLLQWHESWGLENQAK